MNSRRVNVLAAVGVLLVAAHIATPAAAAAGWTIVPTPTPRPGTDLNGVAVPAAGSAWAVGKNHRYGSDHQMAILRWDGSAWTVAAAPNSRCYNEALFDVAFTSAGNGWAVGESPISVHRPPTCFTPPRRGPLVVRWNGTQWSVEETPVTTGGAPVLRAVSPVGAGEAWAVGRVASGSPLAAHFVSGAWQLVPVPTADLYDVAAVSAGDVWAVGSTFGPNAPPVILHRTGTGWTSVASNAPAGSLRGIAAVSATNLWAVGYTLSDQDVRPLILRFSGGSWRPVPAPALPPGVNGSLDGVAALSATDIWAVGRDSRSRTLSMHYDGAAWSIVPSPNLGDAEAPNGLNAVAVHAASAQVWAVGEWGGSVPATLAMRYQRS
jgi:hypothetical protein